MDPKKPQEILFFYIAQPLQLLACLLTFSIGMGLAHHLGNEIHWTDSIFGALLGLFLILMRNSLSAYFDHPDNPGSTIRKEDLRYVELRSTNRQTLLLWALLFLTAGVLDIVILIVSRSLNFSAFLILGTAFLLSFFAVVPPVQFEKKGYGEISEAVLIANFVPAIGFLLNDPDFHVLLFMLTFPLTLTYLAFKIVYSLETYSYDRARSIQTLVMRLDWQKSMVSHNYLVLGAFLLVGVFSLLGQPWSLTWPMMLPLTLGIFQIFQVQGIANGAPPRWRLLKWTALSTFAVTAYLASFTLWIS
ncbi:MAG: hypothetical protein NTZ74_03330 [Chloroflexi bacterium]|nr:hypothetical protein [Chloroflexota bacterium]